MSAFPIYPSRTIQTLDGAWDFAWLGDTDDIDSLRPDSITYTDIAAVPGVFDTAVEHMGRRGVGVYHRKVTGFPCGSLRLKLGGLGLYAKIWWDGAEIEECRLPYSPVCCDFDSRQMPEHDLVIAVDNRFDLKKVPLFRGHYDFYGYGGIYRSVELHKLPETFIERVQVRTIDLASGKVGMRIILGGNIPEKLKFSMSFDDKNPSVRSEEVRNSEIYIEANVPNFKVWSPSSPALHTVKISTDSDCIIERFGIRTVKTEKQQILLNGEPLYLCGVSRHESHPELGPVQNTHLMLDDLKNLKSLGANFIRCVHYTQDQEFLDLCDQTGFLVWHESLGWGLSENDISDPCLISLVLEENRRMIRSSINNPSVIISAFFNECCSDAECSHEIYGKIIADMRKEDSSRLISFASNRIENDKCFDLVDVIAFNDYPGWFSRIKDYIIPASSYIKDTLDEHAEFFSKEPYSQKPLLISEIGICALYGCHDRAKAQWSEEFQADYMKTACESTFSNPRYCGITLWQYFDTRSYTAGQIRGKPRGFNCAGLLDEYRRPKMSYDVISGLFHAKLNHQI